MIDLKSYTLKEKNNCYNALKNVIVLIRIAVRLTTCSMKFLHTRQAVGNWCMKPRKTYIHMKLEN